MEYYKDLREFIGVLEGNEKLLTIEREVNKDTELQPLVRWQFRGLPEKERKAFLFKNVTDAKGRKYNGSVLVGAHAASREVYALAMGCEPGKIKEKWNQARLNLIKPMQVLSGPVKEEIHIGENLLEHGGLEEFPIPISTPGFDNAPYFTAGNWVAKDPETGIYNVGNYRAMLKDRLKLGCDCRGQQHMRQMGAKYRKRGIPMPAALVVGPTPNIGIGAGTS